MFEVQGGIDPGIRSCSLMALEAKLIIGTLCGSDQTADANLWLEIRHLCILVQRQGSAITLFPMK